MQNNEEVLHFYDTHLIHRGEMKQALRNCPGRVSSPGESREEPVSSDSLMRVARSINSLPSGRRRIAKSVAEMNACGHIVVKARQFDDPSQLAVFGSIKTNPRNRLGVDKTGRVHWVANQRFNGATTFRPWRGTACKSLFFKEQFPSLRAGVRRHWLADISAPAGSGK